ncbi:MAG: hypothetical protein ACOH18_00405 [Candidatus Saccharimonadaceae bacterium]
MGFLQMLGLDDLADSVNELTTGFDELREEIITSVIGSGTELKETVNDIAESIRGNETPSIDTPTDEIKTES